jgi:MoaD family protein
MELLVYGPLRAATGSKTVELQTRGDTVGDLLDELVAEYPRIASQLVDSDGDVRPSVRVVVDDERATLEQPVSETQTVKVFPAMRGG